MDILGCIVAWAAVGAGFTSAIFSVGDEALDIEGKYDVCRLETIELEFVTQ